MIDTYDSEYREPAARRPFYAATSKAIPLQRWSALVAAILVLNSERPTAQGAVKLKAETDKPDMVRVERGSFMMGDLFGDPKHEKALAEVPVHEVELDSYEIGRFEVTVAEFRKFAEETGYITSAERPTGRPDPGNWRNHPYRQADNEPAVDLSWDDAIRYCNWLNRKHGLPRAFDEQTGALLDAQGQVTTDVRKVPGYRLPTEAEWEFAARERGKKVRFGNGKDIARADEINFNASVTNELQAMERGTNRARTRPVNEFKPNALGIFQMAGNAWEWCLDEGAAYTSQKQHNPFVPGQHRKAIRGGGFTCDVTIIKCSARFAYNSGASCPASGIRLARTGP